VKIYPIVEGQGEVAALPVLLRRLMHEYAQCYEIQVGAPVRRKSSEFFREDTIKKAVRLTTMQPDCSGVLIVFDGEDGCPVEWGAKVQAWAQSVAGSVPCKTVVVYREYETWFLAAIESLRGNSGISKDAVAPENPESKRNAKGEIDRLMPFGLAYSSTVHQEKFSAAFNLSVAHQRSRSFRKLVKAVGELLTHLEQPLSAWPPVDW
jgi:hypothetical protein